MTKPVITACALTLYDEGLFTLDEPIARHLPEWAAPKLLEDGQLVPARSAITPRMLMSHSSGLYYGDIEKGARSTPGNEADTELVPVAPVSRNAPDQPEGVLGGAGPGPAQVPPRYRVAVRPQHRRARPLHRGCGGQAAR